MVTQFKFLETWSIHSDCRRHVKSIWTKEVVGCRMFILTKRLQMLKQALRELNRNTFGNVSNNVRCAEEALGKIQSLIQID